MSGKGVRDLLQSTETRKNKMPFYHHMPHLVKNNFISFLFGNLLFHCRHTVSGVEESVRITVTH